MKKNSVLVGIVAFFLGCSNAPYHETRAVQPGSDAASAITDVAALPRVTQHLVPPPAVPDHDQALSGGPKIVEVHLDAVEKTMELGDGVTVHALTFNGSVPGPLIVVHQGDYVEITLKNLESNQLRHTIDLHAATGALGGASLMKVDPGEQKSIRFKATKAGVFVYHCAPGGPQIPYHVVSGMNGAIMVLPREGLKDAEGRPIHYDRAYYIGEQDLYLPKNEDGSFKTFPSALAAMPETLKVMQGLIPSHVVFNGAVGSLTGNNALRAKVGERVLFIHSQANRDSRPHLIGGHADLVWPGGSFSSAPASDYETWFVAGGSAVAALYQFREPGTYVYLSHNLIEAVMLGAAAHIEVEGEWDNDLMRQIETSN
ncbi:MAG: copper-containing nitrite reductase [Gammaproteobacteria bacterium]